MFEVNKTSVKLSIFAIKSLVISIFVKSLKSSSVKPISINAAKISPKILNSPPQFSISSNPRSLGSIPISSNNSTTSLVLNTYEIAIGTNFSTIPNSLIDVNTLSIVSESNSKKSNDPSSFIKDTISTKA